MAGSQTRQVISRYMLGGGLPGWVLKEQSTAHMQVALYSRHQDAAGDQGQRTKSLYGTKLPAEVRCDVIQYTWGGTTMV